VTTADTGDGGAGPLVPPGTFSGMTALVTGASRGIGLEVARGLAAGGAWVAMIARGEAELSRMANAIGGHSISLDASSTEGVHSLATYLDDLLGGCPDLVVNAAGSFGVSRISETEPESFDRQIAVNLRAPFLLMRAFLPRMLQRGSGHIVSIGSVAGRTAFPGNGAYSASKFGLRGLHEVLSEELRGTRVRATLLEPSATDTSLWDELDPDNRDDLPSRAAMMRPEDVARAVFFALAQPPEIQLSVIAMRATG
jgi:NAD(P)-dependent dehydrogenase (short-subunit alcohol dehydrogenase family)